MVYAAEFLRNVDMQMYLISSTIRKTTINLNLYKQVKNPLLYSYFHWSSSHSLLFLNCCSVSLLPSFLSNASRNDWNKSHITNFFVIRKFDFQISVQSCKAKFYFSISILWYVGVGFKQKIWSIFCEANMEINFFISDIKAFVYYFLSNFYFSPNDSPLKTMKGAFYFI